MEDSDYTDELTRTSNKSGHVCKTCDKSFPTTLMSILEVGIFYL